MVEGGVVVKCVRRWVDRDFDKVCREDMMIGCVDRLLIRCVARVC